MYVKKLWQPSVLRKIKFNATVLKMHAVTRPSFAGCSAQDSLSPARGGRGRAGLPVLQPGTDRLAHGPAPASAGPRGIFVRLPVTFALSTELRSIAKATLIDSQQVK